MSRALPKELQTQKTSSLPDDLKKIAEELIADKFGVQEEVVPEVDDFFLDPDHHKFDGRMGRGRFEEDFGRQSTFRDEPSMGNRPFHDRDVGEPRLQIQPWDRLRVAEIEISYPRFDCLVIANRKLDMQNVRGGRQREFIMHPEFFDFLMRTDRDVNFHMRQYDHRRPVPEGAKDIVGEIMGCKIIISRGVRHCILRAEF